MVNGVDIDKPADGRFVGSEHRFPLRVYFEDTDLSGLVYHANYLRFMERARSDMLRVAGIDQRAAAENDIGVYAIASLSIRYVRPARLDDDLLILSRVTKASPARVFIQQRVTSDDKILADAEVVAALLGNDGRPRRQPSAWMAIFHRLLGEE